MAILTRLACLVMLLLVAAPYLAYADDALQMHEQEIEAGLIYNFLKYIQWPAATRENTMIVCVYGDDPFKVYLRPMEGRTVNQRHINIRDVRDAASATGCDLLFISAAEKGQWPQLEKSLTGKTVLTVSNFDDFARSGGMIEFGRAADHIQVSLNLDALTVAKFKVEDRLLKLATVLRTGEGQ